MTASPGSSNLKAPGLCTTGIHACPACGSSLTVDANWCPSCNFTGGHTLAMFPDAAPLLLPVLDTIGLLKERDLRKIGKARNQVTKRFPQFHWRVCVVSLPAETSLQLLGFWLLNASPLDEQETAEQRVWTVLLVVNADTGNAAVTAGYAAEACMTDDEWKSVLTEMGKSWTTGNPALALVEFFKSSQRQLERNWKRFGSRPPSRKVS